jgi:hypothetical protein
MISKMKFAFIIRIKRITVQTIMVASIKRIIGLFKFTKDDRLFS